MLNASLLHLINWYGIQVNCEEQESDHHKEDGIEKKESDPEDDSNDATAAAHVCSDLMSGCLRE